MTEHKGLPILDFASLRDWEAWLATEAERSAGLWLKMAKKTAGVATVSKAEAIEGAIAFGWIDGQLDRFDEAFWLIRFTPRGPRSKWSQNNRDTAGRLMAEGRVRPRGLAEIDAAKADGRWDAAYAPQAKADVPPDLQAALAANPAAKAFFDTLRGANRYAILYRLHDAKTAKTRAARLKRFVDMLARGETIHPAGS